MTDSICRYNHQAYISVHTVGHGASVLEPLVLTMQCLHPQVLGQECKRARFQSNFLALFSVSEVGSVRT